MPNNTSDSITSVAFGTDGVVTLNFNSEPSVSSTSKAALINGNTNGANISIGTNDNNSLSLETNNTERVNISNSGNVKIGGGTANSTLDIAGSVSYSLVRVTVNYTVTQNDYIILGDANGGAITIDLPSASGIVGRKYTIKSINNGVVTVTAGAGTENIDASTSVTLDNQYEFIEVVNDGAQWYIVSKDL